MHAYPGQVPYMWGITLNWLRQDREHPLVQPRFRTRLHAAGVATGNPDIGSCCMHRGGDQQTQGSTGSDLVHDARMRGRCSHAWGYGVTGHVICHVVCPIRHVTMLLDPCCHCSCYTSC